MLWGSKFWQWGQWICRRPGLLVTMVLSTLLTTSYLFSENSFFLNRYQEMSRKSYQEYEDNGRGFLVSNSKCQLVARNPMDPSIKRFIREEKFEPCTKTGLLTKTIRMPNGGLILKVDLRLAKNYIGLSCCWAPIHRPLPTNSPHTQIDSEIKLGSCTDFDEEVMIPKGVEIVLVKCRAKKPKFGGKRDKKSVYENIHAVMDLEKVRERFHQKKTQNGTRKLSVLLLGIDNVSRLNFERTLPKTAGHLKSTGWTELKGYNKMADNTFPNLMAVLTGMNISRAYETCTPTKSFGLDNCPLLWYAFRNASYVTAYGEDAAEISTFNYLKRGFVNPPTDFYMRPYIVAAEKYLANTPKRYLNSYHYCAGPEPSSIRIINYALDFAKTFIGVPYFALFWTNTMSHDDINGPSTVDSRILSTFQRLENDGVLNDSMVIFFSDHGLRYGEMRETLQGWYEEKLPFIYIWLPEWFKNENQESVQALSENGKTLTSPYFVYETLRDVLLRAGGKVNRSEGCPQCQSLFSPAQLKRGCDDVGVNHHWCACTTFGNGSISDDIVLGAARKIIRYIDDITEKHKGPGGKRICASLKLKKILRVNEMVDAGDNTTNSNYKQFICQLELTPGNGKFEALIRYYQDGNYTIVDNEVNRLNTYTTTAKCLNVSEKQYCVCE